MNKIILEVSLSEFQALFDYAREIHAQKEEPIPELGVDNIPKIDTALHQPFQTWGGEYLYKGLCKKAAMLFYLVIDNHVMVNGNKRMACLLLSYFLIKNSYSLLIPDKKLKALAKKVANPHDHDIMLKEIETTIRKYLKPFKKNK